jgi:Protein of unknown function (DUF3099)
VNQPDNAPVVITSARASRSDDIRRRQVRYLISMGIRTACFVLVFVVHGPARWAFLVGSLVLPYVAVVIANASSSRQPKGLAPYVADDAHALPGKPPSGPAVTQSPNASG